MATSASGPYKRLEVHHDLIGTTEAADHPGPLAAVRILESVLYGLMALGMF
jgi:hypothetical protein